MRMRKSCWKKCSYFETKPFNITRFLLKVVIALKSLRNFIDLSQMSILTTTSCKNKTFIC